MHSARDSPVVLAYDGSEGAARAIDVAGVLLHGGPAIVVHVWRPLSALLLWNPVLGGPGPLKDAAEEIDAAGSERAARIAAEGTARARAAGFDAEPLTRHDARAWEAIVDLAAERRARAVVAGHRGASGRRSFLPGSVASGVLHHCTRPVLVVPMAEPPRGT
jgi:nucleotide-binding universal stress UspA family protein